jgi:hypothetical protein
MESDAFKDAVRYANRKAEERARKSIEDDAERIIAMLQTLDEPALQRVETALRGRLRFGKW